ncbi:MAG TPA: lysylphosphatidylglycerol synthase transmembrane domain-containing protein [Vicinamibacterales bacterium]
MRSNLRTVIVLAVAAGLVALFLNNVDLGGVARGVLEARPEWLLLSLSCTILSLAIRSLRWQFLLEPLGPTSFANAFRATAVGFAASAVLPARAGEVIRPYFLARQSRRASAQAIDTTGAFATVVVERLLDVITVIILLATYLFGFGRELGLEQPRAFAAAKWSAGVFGAGALGVLAVSLLMARDAAPLLRLSARAMRPLPARLATVIEGFLTKFVWGLGTLRRPGRLLGALAWSFPLWLSIAMGVWSVALAFRLAVPFTGTFLLIALLVIGVAVPTPGSIGGFHEAFRVGVTTFYGVRDGAAVAAAIVLHLITIVPSLVLGLLFAAQEGLSVTGLRRLADQAAQPTP